MFSGRIELDNERLRTARSSRSLIREASGSFQGAKVLHGQDV